MTTTWNGAETPLLPFESAESRHTRQAREFHEANPHVMARLVVEARAIQARGVRKAGIKALFERLRWVSWFETDGDKYRLNNNYTSWYARELMRLHPEFEGLFTTRDSAHDADYHARPRRHA